MSQDARLQSGLVVASHGRHVVVETGDGRQLICHPRGKKNEAVVGDQVRWLPTTPKGDEGSIERIETRRNLFYRQDELRSKSFAANIDQVLILIAAEPEFSESQLARALIAAEAVSIAPLIVLNKSDLVAAHAQAWARLEPYRRMDYAVLPVSLKNDAALDMLRPHLQGKATLVLGPSGAGKSTLVNRHVPGAQAETGEISQALNSGKHTTTHTRWYWVDPSTQTALIDSPGFQEFGLRHIPAAQLASLMPDLREHADGCRFYNCTHLHEPGCGVIAALQAGGLSPQRYRIYGELHAELSQPPRY